MSRSNPDRRTRRTRQAVMGAFIELVLARGYEELTTGEISRKANIGRSTFYLHYANKEELLKESLLHPSRAMAACISGDITAQRLAPLFDHFREQRSLNREFFASPIRLLWVRCLAGLIDSQLRNVVRTAGTRPLLPRGLVALMVAESQIALITHWLAGGYAANSETVAAAFIASTRAIVCGNGLAVAS